MGVGVEVLVGVELGAGVGMGIGIGNTCRTNSKTVKQIILSVFKYNF